MKKGLIIFAMSLILSVNISASEKNDSAIPPANSMRISGAVSDIETNETLAGVMVSIEGTDLQTLTDLDGNFTFKGIVKGNYTLKVNYISYKEGKVENVKVDHNSKNLNLTLESE